MNLAESLNKHLNLINTKIVDENNQPLICYHGSNNPNITEFDLKYLGYNTGNDGHLGAGIYFSTDIIEAKTYGKYIYKAHIISHNPFTATNNQLIQLKNAGFPNIDDQINQSFDFNQLKNHFKNNPTIHKFLEIYQSQNQEKAWDFALNTLKPNHPTLDTLNDIDHLIEFSDINPNAHGIPHWAQKQLDDLHITNYKTGFQYQQSLPYITDTGNHGKLLTKTLIELHYDSVWYGTEINAFSPKQILLI